MQILPDGNFEETGVKWDNGHGVHRQVVIAPERTGLYYFHARAESGEFFSFPLVVAPRTPAAKVAVLASTNTWNAYNAFGGRSNYIMAACMIDTPIVNAKADLPRYKLSDYGEWKSAEVFAPLSFDRPEPYNHIPEHVECTDPIEGRQACHLAPAEWRLLGWLEREGVGHDLYADAQLHDGTLDLDRYRVLILNTHPEYWSAAAYQRVKRWVFEQGGRLMYLGGNGINCAAEFLDDGTAMRCLNPWPTGYESRFHAHVESEANLLGVVFTDPGAMTVAPYAVVDPGHWIFAGTGLRKGDLFGTKMLHARYGDGASGHETDKISPSSPKNVHLLAKGLNPDDGGAHLVYFETPGGGAVFSAGSITFPTALLCDEPCAHHGERAATISGVDIEPDAPARTVTRPRLRVGLNSYGFSRGGGGGPLPSGPLPSGPLPPGPLPLNSRSCCLWSSVRIFSSRLSTSFCSWSICRFWSAVSCSMS